MSKSYYSRRPTLSVNATDENGKTYLFQFKDGVLTLDDEKDIAVFDANLERMPPSGRTLIKTIDLESAAKIAAAHRAQQGPAAAHGTTTATMTPEIREMQLAAEQSEKRALGMDIGPDTVGPAATPPVDTADVPPQNDMLPIEETQPNAAPAFGFGNGNGAAKED